MIRTPIVAIATPVAAIVTGMLFHAWLLHHPQDAIPVLFLNAVLAIAAIAVSLRALVPRSNRWPAFALLAVLVLFAIGIADGYISVTCTRGLGSGLLAQTGTYAATALLAFLILVSNPYAYAAVLGLTLCAGLLFASVKIELHRPLVAVLTVLAAACVFVVPPVATAVLPAFGVVYLNRPCFP